MLAVLVLVCLVLNEQVTLGQADAIPGQERDAERDIFPAGNPVTEGRAKKWKLKLMLKTLLLLKTLLFVFSLPFSALAAKIVSWNAFAFSFLALLTSKLLLLRTLFPGRMRPVEMPGFPPIIIQSSSEGKGPFRGGPKIYIQPELNEDEVPIRKRWRNGQ